MSNLLLQGELVCIYILLYILYTVYVLIYVHTLIYIYVCQESETHFWSTKFPSFSYGF